MSPRMIRVQSNRAGFTLVEMLVALAVLVVALAIVAQVFGITTKTAAQASALAEAHEAARAFLDELQADLEGVDPAESVLVIHGRTQVAALTPELAQARSRWRVMVGDPRLVRSGTGFDPRLTTAAPPEFSDPRADILMFFTERPLSSSAPPIGTISGGQPAEREFRLALQRGAKLTPAQVVYGHASISRAVDNGGGDYSFSGLTHIQSGNATTELSPLPLTRWQLVRRQALIFDTSRPGVRDTDFAPNVQDMDAIMACYTPRTNVAGDALNLSFNDLLYAYSFQDADQDGRNDNEILERSPYAFALGSTQPMNAAEVDPLFDLLYPTNGAQRARRQIATLVERPPAGMQSTMGLRRLPACAWFEVEFLMPEDPRNGKKHPVSSLRSDTPRWVNVTPGEHVVFVPDSEANRIEVMAQHTRAGGFAKRRFMPLVPSGAASTDPANYDIRLWPYAIRVTVRVFDSRGRLADPVVRSLVHRFD